VHNTPFFQLYTIHFELARGKNPVATYCLVRNKIQVVYDRMLNEVKGTIPLASPERILLDFESAATRVNFFRSAFPHATVTGCYFHLKCHVNSLWNWYEIKLRKTDSLSLVLRCLPALAAVPSSDATEVFLILADNMSSHKKIPELLAYFEHTCIRDRRRPGRNKRYGSTIFPVQRWNHVETASERITRTTILSKAGIAEYRHFFNFITQHYGLLW